jgi:hypothetical protein
VRNPAAAVAEAGDLHEEVDSRGQLLPDGTDTHVGVRHAYHDFEPADGVAGAVGVNRGQRTVVARVHGLQHVQRLRSAHLADDDAVGAHTQGVDHQLPDFDRSLSLDVGRPRFHPGHVHLAHLQFGGVLDGDDALVVGDEAGEHVQERGLSGAGSPGDDHV